MSILLDVPEGQKLFIVTVKVAKDPEHDPHNKKTAPCISSNECTDTTGEHHSFLATGWTKDEVRALCPFKHVTRIEEVPESDWIRRQT